MYRSVIALSIVLVTASISFAQGGKTLALSEKDIALTLQTLHQQLAADTNNLNRVALISATRKIVDQRIDEVAMDEKIPYPVVARHYRMGDQLIVLGLLRAKDAMSMTAESCLAAQNQLSVGQYDPTNEGARKVPKHLVSVTKTLEIICASTANK